MKLRRLGVAFRLVPIALVSMVPACTSRPDFTLSIDRVGPTYVPAIQMNGIVHRVVALTISGAPELVTPMLERAQAEGWRARRLSDNAIQIDPIGHSLDQVTALNFRIDNGEFGNLRMQVTLRLDKGRKG